MRIFSNTWKHIRRSPYQAFAAISVMMLTFLVAGLFFILTLGSSKILTYFEQKPQIIVFFKDTKTEDDIKVLAERFSTMPQVASVKYISKEAALGIYKEQFKDDPLLLEMVTADLLPASIEVSATKIEYLPQLATILRQESEIQEMVFPEDVINLLVSWTTTIRKLGFVLVVFLGFVSLFTVFTVISMKIALRREEIDILQLIGASRWYIRMPFTTEGILYGIIGAILGWAINTCLLFYVMPSLSSLFAGIPLFPIPLYFHGIFLGGMIFAGWLLGLLASTLAINRYLR